MATLNIDKLENKLEEEVFEWLNSICDMDRSEQADVLTALYILVENALEQREKLSDMSDTLDLFCGDDEDDDDDEEEEVKEEEEVETNYQKKR